MVNLIIYSYMKLKTLMLGSCAMSAILASAYSGKTESRALFATNPDNGVGQSATMTIDGSFTDWSEDMMIARNGANNMSTAFKGSHENNVIDIYAVFAAWDDQNLYVAWQMCNTGDTWARPGDGPLTDYGKPGDIPMIVALSVDPSKPGMTGKLEDGRCIWVDHAGSGVTFDPTEVHVDHMLFMSAKAGQGSPAIFTSVNATGDTNYGVGCRLFANEGISYQRGDGFLPSALWRSKAYAEWSSSTEIVSDPSVIDEIYDIESYQNIINNDVEGLQPHDTNYDTFFEIKIPLKTLGINRQWLEANGIGCRVIGTRGESALDCCPFDPSMMDNALGEYGKDNSTTHEKDDLDIITYAMADIGKIRDLSSIDPVPDPTPDPIPSDGSYAVYYIGTSFANPTPYCYVWDAGDADKLYAGAWPGTPMKQVMVEGTPMWCYSFTPEKALVKPMVIFNGNGQSKNLVFENYGIYDDSGYTQRKVDVSTSVTMNMADMSDTIYFDLQGHRLTEAPAEGIYIMVKEGKATKVLNIR